MDHPLVELTNFRPIHYLIEATTEATTDVATKTITKAITKAIAQNVQPSYFEKTQGDHRHLPLTCIYNQGLTY